jgi:hypothetical protein
MSNASPLIPLVLSVPGGYVPAIDHVDRKAGFTRVERFPRKAKATAQEALDYAAHVVWRRQTTANELRRRLEILSHPPWLPGHRVAKPV